MSALRAHICQVEYVILLLKAILADGLPAESRIDALNTATPNFADKPTLSDGPPSEWRIDALNTATPNLAD